MIAKHSNSQRQSEATVLTAYRPKTSGNIAAAKAEREFNIMEWSPADAPPLH